MNYFLDRRGPCMVARQIPIEVVTLSGLHRDEVQQRLEALDFAVNALANQVDAKLDERAARWASCPARTSAASSCKTALQFGRL